MDWFCEIGIIPWTFNSNNATSKAQRYQLHKNQILALVNQWRHYKLIKYHYNIWTFCVSWQQINFICLPYTNYFLVISLKCSNHVVVKVEFRVPPAVFLQKKGSYKCMYMLHNMTYWGTDLMFDWWVCVPQWSQVAWLCSPLQWLTHRIVWRKIATRIN